MKRLWNQTSSIEEYEKENHKYQTLNLVKSTNLNFRFHTKNDNSSSVLIQISNTPMGTEWYHKQVDP